MADCRYAYPYEPDLNVPTVLVDNVTMNELVTWFVTHLIRCCGGRKLPDGLVQHV